MNKIMRRVIIGAVVLCLSVVASERPVHAKIECAAGAVFCLDGVEVCIVFVEPSNCEYCEVTVQAP
jgi:hypothetical protein